MQDTVIGDNAVINNIVADKDVTVADNRMLSGSEEFPLYIGKGASV